MRCEKKGILSSIRAVLTKKQKNLRDSAPLITCFVNLLQTNTLTIKVDVSFITKNDDYAQAKTDLENNVNKAKSDPSMQSIKVSDSDDMQLNNVTETPIYGVCIDGSVYGLNTGYSNNVDHSQRCRKYWKCVE